MSNSAAVLQRAGRRGAPPRRSARPSAGTNRSDPQDSIADILQVTRLHLDMDIAFVSEFVGGRRFFRHIDPPDDAVLRRGDSMGLDEGYCKRIVDQVLPELMPDTAAVPAAAALETTASLPIGAHVGVAIRLRDRRLYGTFCCLRAHSDPTLNHRDLRVMHAFAELIAHQIDRCLDAERAKAALRDTVQALIAGPGRTTVLQPIVRIPEGKVVGLEALSRFDTLPVRSPEAWFADATHVGLRTELECAAITSALAMFSSIPEDVYLSINVSPLTVDSPGFASLFDNVPLHRVVLEITEHAPVDDYRALARALAPLRARQLRLAVDDAGAGYASLKHILNLSPDIIKLDMALTRDVDRDPARRALAIALSGFAAEIGCQLVAEGIETDAELETLQSFGVTLAQGYRLCRPAAMADILTWIETRSATPP